MSLYKRSSENVTSMPGCNLVQRLVFEFKTPEQISFSAAKVETIFTTIPSILQNEMFRYPSFTLCDPLVQRSELRKRTYTSSPGPSHTEGPGDEVV